MGVINETWAATQSKQGISTFWDYEYGLSLAHLDLLKGCVAEK